MAKRTKLLSLVVAGVMCFAIGFAVMFSTPKSANADVELPTIAYSDQKVDVDWNSKGFSGLGICVTGGVTTDWVVLEYNLPAGRTMSAATTITFGLVDKDDYASYPHINGAEADGEMAKTSYDVAADSGYVANATDAEVTVKLAIDIANGKVYGCIADGAVEELATFENLAYVSAAATKVPYFVFGGSPSDRRFNNVKIYTEDGAVASYAANNPGNVHHGAASFKADRVTSLNMSSSAVKPTGSEVSYAISGGFDLVNTRPTTSDWIIYEYTIAGGSTYTNKQNGVFTCLSNNGHTSAESTKNTTDRSSYLHAYANTIPPQTIGNNLFAATEDTPVKMAVNTITGTLAYYRNGAWTTYTGAYAASGITGTNRYFCVRSNGATVSGSIKDVVCYDGNGVDLGVTSTMTIVVDPGLPATAVKPAVDNAYYVADSFNIKSATPTTADFIIFEYTVKAGTTYSNGSSAPQNGFITTLSTNGTVTNVDTAGSVDGMLYQFGSSPTVAVAYKWFVTDSNDAAMKIAVNTNTGTIYVQKDGGAWAAYDVHTGASAFTGEDRYFGFTTNVEAGQGITGNIEDLVCYDSDGNDLGVVTSLVSEGTISEDVIEGEANWVSGGRYLINVSYVLSDGTPAVDKALGSVPALKYGSEATTLKFGGGGENLQLFYPLDNGKVEGFDFSEYVNEWYLVKAGTVFGSVILSEDIIIRFDNATVQIFKADHEFAINYANVDGAVNNNVTSRKFADEVVLTAPTMEGKTFYAWDKEIPAYTYGDVTVTAEWYYVDFAGIYASITESVAMTYIVEYTGYTDLYVEASMVYDGENAIVKSGALVGGKFVFDGVLPQHLGDVISLKVTNGEGGEELLAIELSVKDYLDDVIAAESFEDYSAEKLLAFKAVAEDLLYYGAAAQLFTGHDVENLPADLANATDSIGAVESVYAKEGVKDEAYAWKTAKLVYAENIKLCFEIAAPEGAALKVVIANGAEVVTVTEFTANAKGNYEFAVVVAATEFDSALTLTIYDGEEAKGEVLTYSVNSYISMISEMGVSADELTLIERVWCYGQSVKAFTEIA